ncbi:MAG: HPF/RaiA family ribosome-associated protein [Gammaproteobacteria bacterium]|jgi:ribosome-associated translation inhibitor RaiA|nr:HPF/RaiA family ribosome-associated protein [Gammaproteobacteria bacterium]
MHVQVNTDGNVQGREDVTERVRATVSDGLARFADRLTRVEVHLSDENSAKAGADDKRCLIEARVAGMDPVVASHNAAALPVAIDGALDKLRRALDSAIGRLEKR